MKTILLLFLLTIVDGLIAQDTVSTEIIQLNNERIEYYQLEKKYLNKTIESISVNSEHVRITVYKYSGDSVFSNYILLKPHFLEGISETDFLFLTQIGENDSVYYNENGKPFPCSCTIKGFPKKYFSLKKVFNCTFDTVENYNYLSIYENNKFTYGYKQMNGKYLLVESRHYDRKGLEIKEETKCDTFCYQYDSLNRKVIENYVYDCDNFRYQILNEYTNDLKLVYGIDKNGKHLSEKVLKLSTGQFKHFVYYSDSTIEETIYRDENKPLQRRKMKNGKLLESTSWEYISNPLINSETIITKINGAETTRKIITQF